MKLIKILFIWIVLLYCFIPNSIQAKTFDFSDWGVLLEKHVRPNHIDGVLCNGVDYSGLRIDGTFSKLVNNLALYSPESLKSHEEKLAFWINVYNVFAVKIVTDNYPVQSIKDVGGLFKSVWKIKAGVVGGMEYSLNEIEHQILRKMRDPRIHAAIVCASISCPDLSKDVFNSKDINKQLDSKVKIFLANPEKGMKIDPHGKRIFLSLIFDWFEEDFKISGGVLKFIEPYIPLNYQQNFKSRSASISYMHYNWSLNGI
jgi:hypothetical protein